MALQGTLDTFALPDVLRLLASTKKTGRLRLTGGRGSGSVWVEAGAVVGTEATNAPAAGSGVEVLFELLRFKDGSFTFETDSPAPRPSAPADVEPMLHDAEQLLAEWRDIERVVPSMDAWVALNPDLPGEDVVVDRGRWRIVTSIGGGATVTQLADALGLGEVPVCRAVKDLVELGLGTIGERPAARTPGHQAPARAELDALASSIVTDAAAAPRQAPEPRDAFGRGHDLLDVALPMDDRESPVPPPAWDPPEIVVPDRDGAREADEVARQLANLSPKAARAVAAAAHAATEEEREAALAGVVGEDDEPINRGLLLKFLSSVRS